MLEDLALHLEPQACLAGEVLARAGAVGDAVWVVVSGQVQAAHPVVGAAQAAAVLGPGEVVAESLLLMGGAHTATFGCVTDTQLLRLELTAFIAIAQRYPSAWAQLATERMLETALRAVAASVFGAAAPRVMAFAASGQAWLRLAKGDVLARQSDAVSACYLVLSGELVALQVVGGQRHIKNVMRRGDLAGDLPLATGSCHPTHLVATRQTWLLHFECDQFRSLFFDWPEAQPAVLRSLVRHLSPVDAHQTNALGAMRLAVVPALGDGNVCCNTHRLVDALEQGLSRFGPVMVLDQSLCEMLHIVHAPDTLPADHVQWMRLSAWLERQSQVGIRVIMVGEHNMPGWNGQIARECDMLLHAAPGQVPPAADAVNLPEPSQLGLDTAADGAWWRSPHWLCLLHAPQTIRPSGTNAWLQSLPVSEHFHVRDGHDGDINRLARHVSGRAIGMALSGGGARGLAHAGVYQALTDAGVPVDYFSGTSAGALLTCLLASDEGAAVALQRIARSVGIKKNIFGDYTLPVVSLLKSERLRAAVHATFGDQRLEDSWIPCAVVTTNLTRSRQQVFSRGLICEVALASCSLPAITLPIIMDGDLHCDGGLVNNLPVDILKTHGCRYTLASHVGSKLQLNLPSSTFPGAWTILVDRIFHGGRRTSGVPHLVELLVAATTLTSEAALADITASADVFFEPDLSGFPVLNFTFGEQVAKAGFVHARALLAQPPLAAPGHDRGLWALVAQMVLPPDEAASVALAQWAAKRQGQ